jgi:4-diphosphocytidyl-2-C-methyl-D-erythritol kinase
VSALRALAPAKINLGLCLGEVRAGDARHELVSVMQSISLADEVTLEAAAGASGDEVLCPGVPGAAQDNLAARALRDFRAAAGWDPGPLRVTIVKRVPVAAGLGGGSADAAATLRLLALASGRGEEGLLQGIAREIGADVPAQVSPGRWLAGGAGELLEPLPDPSPALEVLLLPLVGALATSAVYAEADRMGLPRERQALSRRAAEVRAALAHGEALPGQTALLENDLQPAAVRLCAQIQPTLAEARGAGAEHVLVSGSGPTVVAFFPGPRGAQRAEQAAAALAGREPPAIRARSVGADFARPRELAVPEAGAE